VIQQGIKQDHVNLNLNIMDLNLLWMDHFDILLIFSKGGN